MLKDFRAFILRGNVVDLAIGVVIGAAFGAIVTAIVSGLINPLVSFTPSGSLENVRACIAGTVMRNGRLVHDTCLHAFKYGAVLSSIISFVLIAAIVFFFVVKPVNHLMEMFKADQPRRSRRGTARSASARSRSRRSGARSARRRSAQRPRLGRAREHHRTAGCSLNLRIWVVIRGRGPAGCSRRFGRSS